MRALNKTEQTEVNRGIDAAGCNSAQILAQKLINENVPTDDPRWDEFERLFKENC